ncbi:MAG: hypothetical protein KAQ68_05045 [Clostridiales bacterium]|nr:hypothetical protein [Clostridiales bacterium]
MNCKQCNFELVDGVDICPQCGASQSGVSNETAGVSMELPTTKPPKKEVKKKATPAVKKDAKKTAKKAQEVIKNDEDKIVKASSSSAEGMSEAVETVKEEKGKSKIWLYLVIIAAFIIVVFAAYSLIALDTSDEDASYVMLASSEDEVFILDGDKLVPLVEDIPEELTGREIMIAKDANSFYVINDAEMDDEYGDYTGDLILLKSNGKETEVDEDVVVGSQVMVGKILWYIKADDEESILCSYDGRKVVEVAQEENLDTWIGTDKSGEAYYVVSDFSKDDLEYEVFFVSNDDSDSIMEDAFLVAVSSDFKKVLLVETKGDDNTLIIYDGKDDFDVIDNVQDLSIDPETFNMLVIADEEDRQLYYIPYKKGEIELDDEVEEIVNMPNMSATYENPIGDMVYYIKDDDLYVADIKGNDTDRILKNADELQVLNHDNEDQEIVYVDDDEIVRLNYHNLKEKTIELPDANDLMSYQVRTYGDWYVYRTEDNKEIFAYNGRKDAIEISDDADEILSFQIIVDGKYILWDTYDQELIVSSFKEKSDEEIDDDVYRYWVTNANSIYYISDYDDDDGTGDLYYLPKIGKDAEKIEKDIATIFRLYYE